MRRFVLLSLAAVAASFGLAACGKSNQVAKTDPSAAVRHGSVLFAERCSGCHTLDKVGTEGSATKVRDRERVDGPNFNVRVENVDNVLYAIRNGGYSGAIMPENIVVGQDAQDVAQFLAKYAGLQRKKSAGPNG